MEFVQFSDIHSVLPDYKIFSPSATAVLAGDINEYNNGKSSLTYILSKFCDYFSNVVFVLGNHEYYGSYLENAADKIKEEMSEYSNFHLLENDIVYIEGIKVIGCTLWTPVLTSEHSEYIKRGINDYRHIKSIKTGMPITLEDVQRKFQESYLFLADEITSDSIVVTHHAPTDKSLMEEFRGSKANDAFVNKNLKFDVWPKYWLHGHTHSVFGYEHNGCTVRCHPQGYRMETVKTYVDIPQSFIYDWEWK